MTSQQALRLALLLLIPIAPGAEAPFEPVKPPAWVASITRMAFLTPGEVDEAAKAGAQVVHTNLVWPYYPLRRDGGGLAPADREALAKLVAECHERGMKVSPRPAAVPAGRAGQGAPRLARPPRRHRRRPQGRAEGGRPRHAPRLQPRPVGRLPHRRLRRAGRATTAWTASRSTATTTRRSATAPPARRRTATKPGRTCRRRSTSTTSPTANTSSGAASGWRTTTGGCSSGSRRSKPDAVLMSWTVNAGRYGHLLHSPRAMPTRLNRLFDLPMQEWWLDETNQGGERRPGLRRRLPARASAAAAQRVRAVPDVARQPLRHRQLPRHERLTRSTAGPHQRQRWRRSRSAGPAARGGRRRLRAMAARALADARRAAALGGAAGQRADAAVLRLQGHRRPLPAARLRRLPRRPRRSTCRSTWSTTGT